MTSWIKGCAVATMSAAAISLVAPAAQAQCHGGFGTGRMMQPSLQAQMALQAQMSAQALAVAQLQALQQQALQAQLLALQQQPVLQAQLFGMQLMQPNQLAQPGQPQVAGQDNQPGRRRVAAARSVQKTVAKKPRPSQPQNGDSKPAPR